MPNIGSKTKYRNMGIFEKYTPVVIGLLLLIILRFWYKTSESNLDQSIGSVEQDWAPPQHALDRWKNEAPFLHCPHGSEGRVQGLKKLDELVLSNTSSFCSCPSEVTFLLVTNLPEDKYPVSEQLYKLCGCKYVHIRLNSTTAWLGMNWSYKYKVTPALQWLEANGESLPKDSYVLFTDAFDTGLIGDASNIVQRFLEYDCEMLGISTVADWPPNEELKQFENEKYPWSKCRPHLSSGAWMARVADAIRYLRIWDDDWRQSDGGMSEWERKKGWDDQMAFRRLHKKFYPRFKVDTLARIWTRSDDGTDCI